jgi:hypothetical protein
VLLYKPLNNKIRGFTWSVRSKYIGNGSVALILEIQGIIGFDDEK